MVIVCCRIKHNAGDTWADNTDCDRLRHITWAAGDLTFGSSRGALGDMTLITLSVVGLGSVMAISSNAFTVVKIVGGLYLLYLGLTMIKSAAYPRSESIDSLSPKNSKLFFNTWFVTALNPKGILFFGAFLPQFINTHSPIAPKLGLLSLSFVILAAINSPAYALLAAKANRLLRSRAAKRKFDFNGGVAISVAGIWAITARPGN
ncbi:MAG: threonine/homoserine/homoserine lactone efflux protein [Arenicella sp.]